MNIAYLVLAHNNPQVLSKMISALSSDTAAFFIHIDKKTNIDIFSFIRANNVCWIQERISVFWGEYSMVEAILSLMKQAYCAPQVYDRLVLLSGSDYPLKCGEYIVQFFKENASTEFISFIEMPSKGKPLSRINTYRPPVSNKTLHLAAKIISKLGLATRDYRKYLGSVTPYSGSTWWALTRGACKYILDYAENNQQFCHYFRNTFASDEMFFHTILGNSIYKDRIQRNVMYDDWTRDGAHPQAIGDEHLGYFAGSEKIIFSDMYGEGEMLFARKFSDNSLNIITKIDNLWNRAIRRTS